MACHLSGRTDSRRASELLKSEARDVVLWSEGLPQRRHRRVGVGVGRGFNPGAPVQGYDFIRGAVPAKLRAAGPMVG